MENNVPAAIQVCVYVCIYCMYVCMYVCEYTIEVKYDNVCMYVQAGIAYTKPALYNTVFTLPGFYEAAVCSSTYLLV